MSALRFTHIVLTWSLLIAGHLPAFSQMSGATDPVARFTYRCSSTQRRNSRWRNLLQVSPYYSSAYGTNCSNSSGSKNFDCFANEDFSFQRDPCSPFTLKFITTSTAHASIKWLTGDGTVVQNLNSFTHIYQGAGNYAVMMILSNGICTDTISKTISVSIIQDDIILTHDTIICAGASKQLRTQPSLKFCWSPATFLDDPNAANPVTSAQSDITYYLTSESAGNSLIVNGDFTNGNTGFVSGYNYTNNNLTEGQYYVGTSPNTWNPGLSKCGDHTTGNGNMLLLNGSPTPNVELWKETISITPNTNYAFSTWVQALFNVNPAQVSFSINGKDVGNLVTASLPTCTWTQFYTTWNSGNNTTATISIVNKNTLVQGNDFALDDISFAPVLIKRDSVIIKVEKSLLQTTDDTSICKGNAVQLNTTGESSYSWTPAAGLSNTNIGRPVATPAVSTKYFVTATSANGCSYKDSVSVNIFPTASISVSNDTSICAGSVLQLFARGGNTYQWTPTALLTSPSTANPVAHPLAYTVYNVLITDINNCPYKDSVAVSIKPVRLFSASPDTMICEGSSVMLKATGGDKYLWSPATYLDKPSSSNPTVTPLASILYKVTVSDTVCNYDSVLTVNLSLRQNPVVTATSSNDINCANLTSQLSASGAAAYMWSPSSGLSDATIANPVASLGVTSKLTVSGTDQYGCKATDTVTVKVSNDAVISFNLPNAFTPNNDGKKRLLRHRSFRQC